AIHDSFEEKLNDLVRIAMKSRGILEADAVNTLINEFSLDNKQIDKLYERLEAYNIVVLTLPEDEKDQKEKLIDIDDDVDAPPSQDNTEITSPGTISDDPVHLYLKESGNYPLLTMEEEVELAKRIEDGDEDAKQILAESNLR